LLDAYRCWFPFGLIGGHRFYLGQWALGCAYALSIGGFGVWWIADCINMKEIVAEANTRALAAARNDYSFQVQKYVHCFLH
jgi:TM2 domain-containing membrane protein YozV